MDRKRHCISLQRDHVQCRHRLSRGKPMPDVVVVIGAGSIGQAIARRVSTGKHVLLADLREDNASAAAKTLSEAGFEVSTTMVDVASRESMQALVDAATALGPVTGLILPPAYHRRKRRPPPSCALTCTARRSYW